MESAHGGSDGTSPFEVPPEGFDSGRSTRQPLVDVSFDASRGIGQNRTALTANVSPSPAPNPTRGDDDGRLGVLLDGRRMKRGTQTTNGELS